MAKRLSNAEVAATFTRLADLLAIRGENRFKGIAYRRAAESMAQAGSARRFRETVGDLDLVAAADPGAVVAAFADLPAVTRVEMRGPNRCRVTLAAGVSADLRVLPSEHWGSLLFHFTGSKYHN